MLYDIYFHKDFDGTASAAIMLRFLESHGDRVGSLYPLDYGVKSGWVQRTFIRPAIVLDFLYHPKATFWYDHHPTTFLKPEWQKRFRETKFKRFDARYDSCCGLVLDAVRTSFGFKPPAHFRELVRWGDIIDKANYQSAYQAVSIKGVAFQIEACIDAHSKSKEFFRWFVPLLASASMAKVVRDKRFRKAMRLVEARHKATLQFYKRNLRVEGNLGHIDLSKTRFKKVHMAPYYFYPKLKYNVTLTKSGSGLFHLSASANPWRRKDNRLHIGRLLQKYGGGGHKDVGGAEFRSRRLAENAMQRVIHILRDAS